MLIWEPRVFTIGSTTMDREGMYHWMHHNDLSDHFSAEADSPISRIWNGVEDTFAEERMIEFGGRHCYRSWYTGRDRADYLRNIIEMGHGSVLEHSTINFAIQGVSRSLSHELVRHRVGVAISQESQRYVDAADINFVVPPIIAWLNGGQFGDTLMIREFATSCEQALHNYKVMQQDIKDGLKQKESNTKSATIQQKRANEAARALLPNAAETRLLWSPNMRLLRHFFWLRGGTGADLEIRRLAVELFEQAQERAPNIFSDMTTRQSSLGYGVPIIVADV